MFYHQVIGLILLFPVFLLGEILETFYGGLDVEEPVIIELVNTPEFQRLKEIHQYGISYYDRSHPEEYTRYAHSLGVFAILRLKGFSLKEQIAGLLHDVSHTVFSHVGDWIFAKENQEKDYQNSIHQLFLEQSTIQSVLTKYGLKAEELLPEEEFFPGLERPLPDLCADRIDYNIQGAYYKDMLTRQEALAIVDNLEFYEGDWVCTNQELMKRLVRYSLDMSKNCWGGVHNDFASRLLAEGIIRGIEIGLMTKEELHQSTDAVIWEKLNRSEDLIIQKKIDAIGNIDGSYEIVEEGEGEHIVKSRFRGIDPWILIEGKKYRLTSLDPQLAEEYFRDKEMMMKGWKVNRRLI